MKSKFFLRVVSLLALLVSLVPASNAGALPLTAPPPADMFQLPWDLGIAWVAIDGIDNGTRRPLNSSHNFSVGGAIDFAPHNNMRKGEDTSRFWVAAAAAGTVVAKSFCHVKIDHGNGWTTEYQFLANLSVKVGDSVARNQRLGIIADGVRQPFCSGSSEPNVPHLHFMLRPTLINATLAGWEINYLPVLSKTTFRKNGQAVGLFQPLLNVIDSPPTPTPTPPPTNTPGLTPSSTPTREMSATPTLFGPYVSTTVDPTSIEVGEISLVTIRLHNVPSGGYLSAEFACHYDPRSLEASNITVGNLFGTDPVTAMNGPQNGNFILAIAGSNGNKATSSGTVFTFNVKGIYPGQNFFGCEARVSDGSNLLTEIPSARAFLTVLGSTPTPNLTPSTPTVLPSTCDRAEFIADINVPPGTVISPGAQFTKTWRLKNIGPCDWTTSYQLVFFSGEQMGGISSVPLTQGVAVGQTVDITINLIAPNAPGSYRGYWMFRNSTGANFGIGPEAKEPWFVEITVAGPTLPPSLTPSRPPSSPTPTATPDGNSPTPSITPGGPTATPIPNTVYDFAVNACAATWFSGAGQLPCPGTDGDAKGFILKVSNPRLETGAFDSRAGLLTFPQNVQNGYIQGFYPPFHVQNGDRFRSILNCEYGATNCYLAFRLDYQVGSEPIRTLWGPFLERYEGRYYTADVDLSSLAGKDVKFILTVLSAGVATGDRALWVGPVISRTGSGSTPTSEVTSTPTPFVSATTPPVESPTPTATQTALPTIPAGWLTLTNNTYRFRFQYPQGAQIVGGGTDNSTRINLPFVPGTNLSQKYLQMTVAENADPCRSPLASSSIPQTSETVVINGITFLKETGEDGTAGHINKWTAYSTMKDNACVSLDFVLRAANPGVFQTPPPLYNEAAESLVFGQIVSTYQWLDGPVTSTPTPTATQSAPVESSTPTGLPDGTLTGKVLASKPVTVNLYSSDNVLVTSVTANVDGTFSLTAPAGVYTITASASGYLKAEGSATITAGGTSTKPTITLWAGDIDGNAVIDQFDALSIGMSYNSSTPPEADLNNDGVINVLDLELLANSYRKLAPQDWN
jgi:murein DD-endopeptidase MepM/ murein hydrolase activator NlpD